MVQTILLVFSRLQPFTLKSYSIAGLALSLTLTSCGDYAKKNVAKMMKSDTMIYTQEARNVTIDYSDSGLLKAKITAPKLIGYKVDGNEIVKMPKGIVANFYNDSGAVESYLTAEYGISYQTKKITEVTRNVQLRNNKGERLNTEKLVWDQRRQLIYTDKFVRITTNDEVLTGEGLESKQDFSNWHILKPRGRIKIKKDSTNHE